MRLRIDGREYTAVSHKGGATLLHVLQLKRESRAALGYELGLRELDRMAKAAEKLKRDIAAARKAGDDDRVAELQAEAADDGMVWLAVVLYLSRRKAGEQVSFREAVDVDMTAVEWIREDGDPEDDEDDDDESPDPTSPGSASPATAGQRARGRAAAVKAPAKKSTGGRSTRTTSSRRSGSGSR